MIVDSSEMKPFSWLTSTGGRRRTRKIVGGLTMVLLMAGCIGENQEATSPDDFEVLRISGIPDSYSGEELVLSVTDVSEFDATDSHFSIGIRPSTGLVDITSFTPGGHRYGYVRDYCFLEDVMVEYSDGSQDVLFEAGFCAEVETSTINPNK